MAKLHHHPLDPQSRFIRLVLAEMGASVDLVEERPWERREGFLQLNPAAVLPVLVDNGGLAVPGGMIIAEYLDEIYGETLGEQRLLPKDIETRVEVRRLVEWFTVKFHGEVSDYLVTEKVLKRFMPAGSADSAPDTVAIRAGKANVRYHLRYIGFLARRRNWLAGDRLSYADFAAAAHLSVVDYLGDVPWEEDHSAKDWYARLKSRPSFRPLLAETVRGTAPSATYADLDF
jgi:glutathione S-transferase